MGAGDLAEGHPDESGASEAPSPPRGRAASSGGKLGTVLLLGAMTAFRGTTSLSALCCRRGLAAVSLRTVGAAG